MSTSPGGAPDAGPPGEKDTGGGGPSATEFAGVGIQFEDVDLAHALGFAALALILAEGGLTTEWRDIRPSMRLGVSLATVGVAITVCVVAVAGHLVLGLDWRLAVLLGAVTAPTDAAAGHVK